MLLKYAGSRAWLLSDFLGLCFFNMTFCFSKSSELSMKCLQFNRLFSNASLGSFSYYELADVLIQKNGICFQNSFGMYGICFFVSVLGFFSDTLCFKHTRVTWWKYRMYEIIWLLFTNCYPSFYGCNTIQRGYSWMPRMKDDFIWPTTQYKLSCFIFFK